jgi:hypothetical protein
MSEHKGQRRITTVIVVFLFGLLTAIGAGGTGVSVLLWATGQLGRWPAVLLLGMSSLSAGAFGFLLFRFMRRMFSVRCVRLLDEKRMEIISWGQRSFVVALPEDIEHVIVDDTDLTVVMRAGHRRFIISAQEFTQGDEVKRWIHACLQSVRKSTPPSASETL